MEKKENYEISEITNLNLQRINECLLLSKEIDRMINGTQLEKDGECSEKCVESSIRTTVRFEEEKIEELVKVLITIRESL